MTSRRDDDGSIDGVWVHAALIIMMHSYERPVGDHTSNPQSILGLASDQILNRRGVEQLDIRESKNLREQRRGEERRVLHHYEVAFILVWHANVTKESIGRLAHDHGREELAAKPSTAAGGNTGLNDGDLQVRTLLGEHVGGGQAATASADDDDVRLGILIQVLEVAARHGARHLTLTDGREVEVRPAAEHLLDGLGGAIDGFDRTRGDGGLVRQRLYDGSGSFGDSGWWRPAFVRAVELGWKGSHDPFAGIIQIKFQKTV